MGGGWIEAAFDLLQQPLAESDIADRLTRTGCSQAIAEKLLAFLPLACGRALLANTGVQSSEMFRGMSEDGTVGGPQPLSADPYWSAITTFVAAQRMAKPEAVRVVGTRSAEFDAISKALANGSKLADLVGSDPIFLFVAPSVAPNKPRAEPATPWWAFWRRI